MRKNKFRSWDEEEGKFYYFRDGHYYDSCDYWISDAVCYQFEWENAEEFTGKQDKNVKDIYENDKVKTGINIDDEWHERIGVITWNNEFSMFEQKFEDGEQCMDVLCEIIGDIHT